MTEAFRDDFLAMAETNGWLQIRDNTRKTETLKAVAKKMLSKGMTIEDIVEATELSVDTVMSIAN